MRSIGVVARDRARRAGNAGGRSLSSVPDPVAVAESGPDHSARRHSLPRLPSDAAINGSVRKQGGLVAYGPDSLEQYRRR